MKDNALSVMLAILLAPAVYAADVAPVVRTEKEFGILTVTAPAAAEGQLKNFMIRAMRENGNGLFYIPVNGNTAEVPAGTYVHFVIDVYYQKDGKTVRLVNFGKDGRFNVSKGEAMEAKFDRDSRFVPIISQADRTLKIGTRMPDAAFSVVHVMQTVAGKSESIAPDIKVTLADDEKKIIAQGKQRYG